MKKKLRGGESAAPEKLPPPETFTSVGEWYRVYRGRVPIQMAAGLERMMKEEGVTFATAYRRLVASGNIIEIGQDDAPKSRRKK